MLMPIGHENMSPVQLALEVALHELTVLHGLHVTDKPEVEYTWDIDTNEATGIIEKALVPLRLAQHKENVSDVS